MNELPPDARFRIESIASEKRISSLVVADLNGDGRPDIAYYGDPKELIVLYNQGTNGWSAPKRWPIDDGQLSANALCDRRFERRWPHRPGVAGRKLRLFPRAEGGPHAGEPQKIPVLRQRQVRAGAGYRRRRRSDLLLVNWEDRNPFRFRLQKQDGELGPEIYFSMPPIRVLLGGQSGGESKDAGHDHRSEFRPGADFAVHPQTGRAALGDFRQGQFQVLPLNKTDKARRGIVVG